jgi:hypothetical protein
VLCLLLGFSLFIAICSGTPQHVPAVALGSPLLLCLERTLAMFAGVLVLMVVLVEAWRGNLPAEISGRGVRYERLRKGTADALASLTKAVAEERKAREVLEARMARSRVE